MAEDNFYIINSWMIDELNLSGIELQVFAIIWSLSRGEKQMYIAGNAHLVRMTKKSEPTIIAALKKLCEKELIKKIPVVVNKVERNYYKAICQGTKESLGGYLKNLSGGTKEILAPNNKEIYKENNKENKRLSNDNQKVVYSEDFISFWKLYHNGGKQQAYKAWNKLTQKEKQKAIDNVNDYLKYCKYKGRTIKDTSSYLNQKGFDEDWLATPECYVVQDTDESNIVKFKTYMVLNHQALIFHRNPLTYEQIHECFDRYTFKQTEWALNKLKERDIHQYFSIAKGIEAVIDDNSEFEDEE